MKLPELKDIVQSKWNKAYMSSIIDNAHSGMLTCNVGASHLIGPINYTTNPALKEANEINKEFLI